MGKHDKFKWVFMSVVFALSVYLSLRTTVSHKKIIGDNINEISEALGSQIEGKEGDIQHDTLVLKLAKEVIQDFMAIKNDSILEAYAPVIAKEEPKEGVL
jgi:hypothetical protein